MKAKKTRADGADKGRTKKGRANGHGTLERKASGIYIARWTANGKRYARSTGTRDARAAAKLLEEYTAPYRLESERDTARHFADRAEGKAAELRAWRDGLPALAVADAFDEYAQSGLSTDAAVKGRYRAHYARLAAWIAANRPEIAELRQITQADAAAFAADLKGKTAAGTFNKHIVFFRRMWQVLADADAGKTDTPRPGERPKAKLTGNPWRKIAKREKDARRKRELTVAELHRVLNAAQGEMRLLFALGTYTGLRLGDCALLDWGRVDLARGLIVTVPRKTKRHGTAVTIPIPPLLARMLEETPTARRRGDVLPDVAAGYRRDAAGLSKAVQAVFAGCGIATQGEATASGRAAVNVGFHSLRHTFVSMCANAGVPLAMVQGMVGHTTPAMTMHYFHEDADALKRAVSALPDVTRENVHQDGADAPTGVLGRFYAIAGEMTADEKRTAAAFLKNALRGGRGK